MSSQSEIETGLFYFFPFLVRKGSWLFHLTLVMDHGELRMSFHVSMKQQYLYSWSLFYHTILPHSMTSFLFDFIPLKPQGNACNIVGQQLPTLLDFTVCICLHTLLQVVVCCWTKFETGQTFKPTTPQHSYLWPFTRKGGLWISPKIVNFFHGHGAWIWVFTPWISNSTPVHSICEFFTLSVKLKNHAVNFFNRCKLSRREIHSEK